MRLFSLLVGFSLAVSGSTFVPHSVVGLKSTHSSPSNRNSNGASPFHPSSIVRWQQKLKQLYSSASTSSAIPQEYHDSDSAVASSSTSTTTIANTNAALPVWKQKMVRAGMMLYILSLCIALPATLLPQQWAYKLKLMSRQRKEHYAVRTACFCSRWLLRLVPFCHLNVVPSGESIASASASASASSRTKQIRNSDEKHNTTPVPSIWVCNHTSMLDIFMLLAADKRLRGPKKRPIKIVYWKQLEDNPVTKLLFRQAGFVSVDMEANGSGNANAYNKATFKQLLKDCKQAFADGFDIGLLPEGQLNPAPEQGLLPVFTGAFTLAKMSRRPIQMMALHGAHHLWHATDGMKAQNNKVTVRCYPFGRQYQSADDFKATFSTVVGEFGAKGEDLPVPELKKWLKGEKWQEVQREIKSQEGQQA